MAWFSSWLPDGPDALQPANIIAGMGLFAIGTVTSSLIALVLVARVRARFVRQSEQIAEANRRFQVTFDQAAVGICHIDRNGRWIRVNDRFCTIVGYPREELLDRTVAEITHPDDADRDMFSIGRLIAGEIAQSVMEMRYCRKDGEIAWTNVTRSLVRDEHGEPDFFVSVVEEISARMRAEERLRTLQNEFAHLARVNELGEMAAAIAHEINQPLAAIVNYLNSGLFLAEQDQGAQSFVQITADMNRASEQALRAGEIVRRLRTFIGQSSGARTVENLEELVDSAMELALLDAKYSGVLVETRFAEKAMTVEVDAIQIHQVLVNLMRNAIEAMSTADRGQERRLIISAKPWGDAMVNVTISDTGPGISPNIYDRLFEPFVTSKSNGMGIGLSVCHRLVEAHGGTISVDNRPGNGAAFTFSLPRTSRNSTA